MQISFPREGRQVSGSKHLADDLGKSGCIEFQSVSATDPKPNFEPLEHSVYEGRRRLGRYVRIAPTWYAAFDAEDRPLGEFSRPQDACKAVVAISQGAQDEPSPDVLSRTESQHRANEGAKVARCGRASFRPGRDTDEASERNASYGAASYG
jgi:hypothetical protein